MKAVTNPKILVVDDDAALAECLDHFLQEAGFAVQVTTDSSEALAKITEKIDAYDILISDNSMPHLSGMQLIDQARKAGFQGKVVVYSGSVSPDEENEFKALGADVILRKPFDFKILIPTIVDLCGHDEGGGDAPS